ncbi:hypothetical protein Hdeb2414_s0019g00544851 [Helianthus debilis subsp. tardiflorus]
MSLFFMELTESCGVLIFPAFGERDLLKSRMRYLEVMAFIKSATLIFSSAPT